MSASIDPIEFGKLLQEVRHLSAQLEDANERMETLAKRLGDVEDKYRFGKAAAFGAVMVLGAAVYGVKDLFARIFGALAP